MKRPRVDVLAELDELQQLAACGRGAPDRLRGLASSGDPLLSRWSHLLHTAASLPQHKPVATPVSEEEGQDEEEGDEEAHEEEGLGGKTGLFFPTSQLRDNFDALAGLEGPKQALLESLVLPRLYPGCFRRNFCPFKRILLFGPPGTGKSSLVRAAVARAFGGDATARFAELSASDVLSSMFGGSEQRVRALFVEACLHGMQRGPVVVYLDEIDSLARTKHATEDDTTRRVKNELLRGLEALEEAPNVYCVASTNTPWELDRAIVRRFERRLLVALPDETGRRAMMTALLSGETEPQMSLDEAVRASEGYSGADLQTVCRFASMAGVRDLLQCAPHMTHEERQRARPRDVSQEDLAAALRTINPSVDAHTVEQHLAWARNFGET